MTERCSGAARRSVHPPAERALAGGAIVVALLTVLAPAVAAGNAPLGHAHAPYKGAVTPNTNTQQTGCTTVRMVQPWAFNLSSGSGGIAAFAKAAGCRNAVFGFGASSALDIYGAVEAAVTFKPPARTTSIQANVNATWSASLKSSDGGRPVCTQGGSYDNTGFVAQWGYTKSSQGNYYQSSNSSIWDRTTTSSGYSSSTQWSNYTAQYTGIAPIPRPFPFNGTTAFTWSHNYGGDTSCSSSSGVSMNAYAQMYDETNSSWIYLSSSRLGGGGTLFGYSVQTVNSTSWNCYNSTNWDGPSNSWSNSTLRCNSYNRTVTSYWTVDWPLNRIWQNSNNSVTFVNSSSTAGAFWWNYTFNHSDRYALMLVVYGYIQASDNWPAPGQGSILVNMATLGNGFRLTSIGFS